MNRLRRLLPLTVSPQSANSNINSSSCGGGGTAWRVCMWVRGQSLLLSTRGSVRLGQPASCPTVGADQHSGRVGVGVGVGAGVRSTVSSVLLSVSVVSVWWGQDSRARVGLPGRSRSWCGECSYSADNGPPVAKDSVEYNSRE